MNYDYKNIIIKMVEQLDDSEERFLIQLYTIIKRHFDRKGKH